MRILIIRPGAIGDTLLTLPVIQALRIAHTAHSVTHITLVGNAAVLPLAQATGIVDVISDYEQLQWSTLFSSTDIHRHSIAALLQQTDLAICWLRDANGIVGHNLRQAGVKRVITAPGRPPAGQSIHVTRYLAESVGASTIDEPNTPDTMTWQLPSLWQDTAAQDSGQQTVAIHPGSGAAQKCWPVAAFAAVIERLWQHGHAVLLLAGPADHQRLATLQQRLPSPAPTMLRVLAEVPLLDLAQQLRGCQCYLGNDSGITHLAALLGLPTIALFGPSNPIVWRPLGPAVTLLHAPDMAQLPIELVIERVLSRLS